MYLSNYQKVVRHWTLVGEKQDKLTSKGVTFYIFPYWRRHFIRDTWKGHMTVMTVT